MIKQVPLESVGGKILFAGTDGKFYSAKGRELKPGFSPGMQNHKGGSIYPIMNNFKSRPCHHLIYETFVGPRTPGMEIDHLNGILFIDHIKGVKDAFYKLNDKGDLEPLDYDTYIKNNKDLYPDGED